MEYLIGAFDVWEEHGRWVRYKGLEMFHASLQ